VNEARARDDAPGEATGLAIPTHPDALIEAGCGWLTTAFHAYGSLSPGNAVTAILGAEAFAGGNSGDKLVLTLDYAHGEPGLEHELFVKFSRCLGDPFRDRRRAEMHGEVKLAALSRHPEFPVAVAKAYFADFDPASGTGVLISQRIRFGEDGIQPALPKNMDHRLANPLEYYRATTTALARLAGTHQSGRLSPQAEELFPFDRASSRAALPLPWTPAEVAAKAEAIMRFIAQCPALFPASITSGEFTARFREEVVRFAERDSAVRRFLHADPRLIALAHWNTHIDNAWFWRDADGVLRAGLLDWGMVRQMNLATALWGGLSGARTELWDASQDELLALFAGELARAGGAKVSVEDLRQHLNLSVGMLTLALMLDTPALLTARMPEIGDLTGLTDPGLQRDKVVQGFLHTFVAALNLWARNDFGRSLAALPD